MAVKRMLSNSILDTDYFLQMPVSTRLLYYEFCMRADDDGFIDAPLKIIKMVGCSEDDLRILITKKFLLQFNDGIYVITHWFIHNTIRKDRYNPTIHINERNSLIIIDKVYQFSEENTSGNHWLPSGCHRIEKNRSNSNNICDENGKTIFDIIEEEFGRTISPMEFEYIKSWDYDFETLKLAVKEASTNAQKSIRYIDGILYKWKQAGIKNKTEALQYIENFRAKKKGKSQLSRKDSADQYPDL